MASETPSAETLFAAIQVALDEAAAGAPGIHAEDILSALATHAARVILAAPTKSKRDYCRNGFLTVLDQALLAFDTEEKAH